MTTGTNGTNSFPAGGQPSAMVVDPSGDYLYVTNFIDATVTAYSITAGTLTPITSYTTGLQPVAIGIDMAMSKFLYTVNYLGNSVSGFQLNATDGTLLNTQNSTYRTDALPTAMTMVPHEAGLVK
jgi:6-phosphogluconolactonase (cycloisomerase 2 family)